MFESVKALSINSHETVLSIQSKSFSASETLLELQNLFEIKQIPFPQILNIETSLAGATLLLTGPQETMVAIKREISQHSSLKLSEQEYSTVSLTCTGVTSPDLTQKALANLEKDQIQTYRLMMSSMTISFLINAKDRKATIESLHQLI